MNSRTEKATCLSRFSPDQSRIHSAESFGLDVDAAATRGSAGVDCHHPRQRRQLVCDLPSPARCVKGLWAGGYRLAHQNQPPHIRPGRVTSDQRNPLIGVLFDPAAVIIALALRSQDLAESDALRHFVQMRFVADVHGEAVADF